MKAFLLFSVLLLSFLLLKMLLSCVQPQSDEANLADIALE